jgi:serine/threonine protein kinase
VCFRSFFLVFFNVNFGLYALLFWQGNISREVQTMILVDHPNVLKSHCSFVSDHNLWVVMPFMAGGSCLHILKAAYPDGFEELVIATILREVLKGIEYLHQQGHIHRDVKVGNPVFRLLSPSDRTFISSKRSLSPNYISNHLKKWDLFVCVIVSISNVYRICVILALSYMLVCFVILCCTK